MRNKSFSSKQSGTNQRVISPRMTTTPLLDSIDRLAQQKEKPSQMLGSHTDNKVK